MKYKLALEIRERHLHRSDAQIAQSYVSLGNLYERMEVFLGGGEIRECRRGGRGREGIREDGRGGARGSGAGRRKSSERCEWTGETTSAWKRPRGGRRGRCSSRGEHGMRGGDEVRVG